MKKISFILSIFLFISVLKTSAQIIQAEYFWDIDPGNGNATAITATDGNLNEVVEELFKNNCNLPSGPIPSLHSFNIRVKDAKGNWGPLFKSIIKMDSATAVVNKQIIQAEYFWDNDPGQGNANTILALDGNYDEVIETAFNNSVPLIAGGLHKFCIRVKDEKNNWGPVFCSVVSVEGVISTDIINAKENTASINVFPNPSAGSFTVQSLNQGVYTIVNELGQTIEQFQLNNSNNYSVTINSLSNGVYFILGYSNNQLIREKLIINK